MVSQRIGGNEGNILWEKNQNNYSKYRLRLRRSKNRVIWKQMLFILAARMSCIKIKIKCSSQELVFLSKIILVYTCSSCTTLHTSNSLVSYSIEKLVCYDIAYYRLITSRRTIGFFTLGANMIAKFIAMIETTS